MPKRREYKKTEFIKEILDYANKNKVDVLTKNKLIGLVAKEIDKADSVCEDILARVEKLEVKSSDRKNDDRRISQGERIHNPSNCIQSLKMFSTDENWKWFTHEPDINIDMGCDYIIRAAKDFNQKFKKDINPLTYFRIYNFLFNTDPNNYWLDYKRMKVYYSWAQIEIDWCDREENKGKWPTAENVTVNVKDRGELKYFRDVVDLFKNTIEFRADATKNNFYNFLRKELKLADDFDSIEFRSIKEIATKVLVYSDKFLLGAGINKIVTWMQAHKGRSNRVEVELNEKNDFYELVVRHCGSSFKHDKTSSKLDGLGGDFQEIRKDFFGVCDFKIRTKLNDGNVYDIICLEEGEDKMEKNKWKKVSTRNRIKKVELEIDMNDVEYYIKIYRK